MRAAGTLWRSGAVVLLVLSQATDPARALDAGAAAPPADESIPPARPLPEYVEPQLPRADAAQLAHLDAWVSQLLAPNTATRLEALARIDTSDASGLPAVAERFEQASTSSAKVGIEVLLEEIRREAGEPSGTRRQRRTARKGPRLLELVVRHPDRTSGYLRPLTELLAYARMFEAVGTWPAVRRLVSAHSSLAEPLRSDCELGLETLGDRALPALIESTADARPTVAAWARAQLEKRGKHVASEAIQVPDPALRADILLAYGKARDVGTARLLIAFAASERAQIRLAARQAVTLLGELGLVELRDAYETATGNSAPRDWSWRRVAEELFARFDGQRSSEVYGLFNEGRAAEARGDLNAARAAFDQVLARDPLFERGAGMVPVYLAFAERQADADPAAASLAARRAERLAAGGPLQQRASSLRYTLDVAALMRRGVIDEALLQRARSLDPDNRRAAAIEHELAVRNGADRATFRRHAVALAVLALTLLALIGAALRLRRSPTRRA